MPDDLRYEVALSTALCIVHTLSVNPRMPRQHELATVIYAVLDAIRQVEERLRLEPPRLTAPPEQAQSIAVRNRLALPDRSGLPAMRGGADMPYHIG